MAQLHKRHKGNEGEDIFHILPESLTSRILSILSTKDAVRTSVLSKNWRYRWTCVTKLDIDDTEFYSLRKKKGEKQCFVNFIYSVLLLTKWESVSLVVVNKYDASLVNTWISSILYRDVRYLLIKSRLQLSFSALTSHFLFNSTLLETLILQMVLCAIVVPNIFVYFGHLKFLKLSGITFTLDSSYNLENLRFYFPVLKMFVTINCTWSIANGITLEAPLLERVFIDNYCQLLPYQPDKCAVKFSASCLKEFTYRAYDHTSQDFVLLDPTSARNASASITLYNSIWLVEPSGAWLSCEVLLALLQKSPVLMTLTFKELPEFDQELLDSPSVPDCFLSILQKVKFGSLHGYEHELCFAKFVMQNCSVLESLSFSRGWPSKLEVIEEFKEKLLKGFRIFVIV